jgi:hypothetical protein
MLRNILLNRQAFSERRIHVKVNKKLKNEVGLDMKLQPFKRDWSLTRIG